MSYGLALAGGGTRGAAHAGVLLALKEENLLPDYIAGTSAGSIAAGCFASGMEPEDLCQMVSYLSKYGTDYLDPDIKGLLMLVPQFMLHRKVSLDGLLRGSRMTRYFGTITKNQTIEAISFPLLIPSVDLITGDTICFTNIKNKNLIRRPKPSAGELKWEYRGKLGDIMMASCSVPGVFRPMKIGGCCLVDGGVTNNLPVDLLIEAGVEKVVAVDIGSGYEMLEEECVFEILSHSFSIMSENLKECRSQGEIFLLRPQITNKAGLLTFAYMEECMEAAYSYTKKNSGRIRRTIER